ncbi:MAG TPA: H4MPT-linked C1 transfer pathway protein [Euryarchaeota archaeon]|nr:H4MPT-linked C1 transfer pathway protein [Euryarchaeota archaeon]
MRWFFNRNRGDSMKIVALDIGGANTKILVWEDGKSESQLEYFPFWTEKQRFKDFLSSLDLDADIVAITMTAELCDVFSSKEEGAQFIADCCFEVFERPLFLTSHSDLRRHDEIKDFKTLAATNWLASKYYLEKRFDEGILVDVGSTTTDIIPFGPGASGFASDFERLKTGRLLYTGLLRTPANTIVTSVPVNGRLVPVASEYFAITADVYNILWGVDYTCDTPDGAGKTQGDSLRRVSRLLCAEPDEVKDEVLGICEYIHDVQVEKIAGAIENAVEDFESEEIIAAGVGRRLAIEAAKKIEIDALDLETQVDIAWNLPCLGLLELVLDSREV